MSGIACVDLLFLTFIIFRYRSYQQRTSMYVLLLFSFTKRWALSGFSFYLTLFIKKVIFISRCYFLQKTVTVSSSRALFDVVNSLEI